MNPFCIKLERRRESDGRFRKGGQFLKNFIYELFRGYFHMAASDI